MVAAAGKDFGEGALSHQDETAMSFAKDANGMLFDDAVGFDDFRNGIDSFYLDDFIWPLTSHEGCGESAGEEEYSDSFHVHSFVVIYPLYETKG